MPSKNVSLHPGFPLPLGVRYGAVALASSTLLAQSLSAQTVVGPGPISPISLSTGTATVVGGSSMTASGVGLRVTGGTLTLDNAQGAQPGAAIDITSTSFGAYLTGGSLLLLNGPVNITTSGSEAAGIWAQNAGASATTTGTLSIHTTGAMSAGAVGAYGVMASNQGTLNVSNATIVVDGAGSTGPYAYGGTITLANTSVRTTAVNAQTIGTLSYGSYGVIANVQNGLRGSLTMTDGTVDTVGVSAIGAFASSADMDLTRVTVTTAGSKAYGVNSSTGATVIGRNLQVTATGPNAYAARAISGSTQTLYDSTIRTTGTNAYSLIAMGNNSAITGTNLGISSLSLGSPGATAWASNATDVVRLTLTGGSVTTAGSDSDGVIANEVNSSVSLAGTAVTTSGAFSNALKVNGGTLAVSGGAVVGATGADSAGLYAGGASTGTSRVTLTDVTLSSAQSDGIQVANGDAQINLTRTSVTGAQRWLVVGDVPLTTRTRGAAAPTDSITVSDTTSEAQGVGTEDVAATVPIVPAANDPVQAAITATAARLNGAATTAATGTSDVTLQGGTVWNLTGNSNLTTLTLDNSRINFSAPAGGVFKTLTVNNYVGTGGTLALNTYLGADGSPSDKLVINGGTATGTTGLQIANAGGSGALTVANGILVVDAQNGGTTAANAFTLVSPVVAGPYEYQLFKGSTDASGAENWYLRSEAVRTPTPSPQPLFRPEVGAYLSNQRQAGGMFLHSLHDRLGEPQWIEGQTFDNQDDKRRSAWLRVVNKQTDSTSSNGIFGVDTDMTLIQGGGDLARWAVGGEQGRLHLGAMLGYGRAKTDATAQSNVRQARGVAEGWSVGAYGTWFQNDADKLGAYIDVWGTHGWFNNSVQGDKLAEVKYNAKALTLSGEAGYAVKVRDSDWVVEPQVQLAYVRYSEGDITEPNGTQIASAEGSGWISRLGVRVHRTWVRDNGRKVQPYLTLNWWHDKLDDSLRFNTTTLQNMYPDNRYELKLGLNSDLGKGWSAWGNLGYQWGSQDFHATSIRVGAKYSW